jgi:hypothetical protein
MFVAYGDIVGALVQFNIEKNNLTASSISINLFQFLGGIYNNIYEMMYSRQYCSSQLFPSFYQ